MKTGIYHTENAGVYLTTPYTGILIDGAHQAEAVGFSPMTEQERILKKEGPFTTLSGLLFTHLHIDHFKAGKVTDILNAHPDLAVWGPGLEKRRLMEYSEEEQKIRFRIGDFTVFAYKTYHSGELYQTYPHATLLFRNEREGESILVSGDAVFYPEDADRIRKDAGHVDLAFVMIYELIEKSSLQFLEELDPGRILLYHYPKPEEDTYNVLSMVNMIMKHNPLPGRTLEMPEQHSWVR